MVRSIPYARSHALVFGAFVSLVAIVGGAVAHAADDGALAFPGALGPAATTPGGRGGQVLRVTTLAADGPGSLRAALSASGPRIVVFEVGGVIDLARTRLEITEPFLTVAGQTAPTPGITLIRGGINVRTHDVVIRHIRVRPGEAGAAKHSDWEIDALSTVAAHDVIVDHCSLTWATDENLSASGPRLVGTTLEEHRAATSHRITFSNNLIAEGLAYSTHAKGEHSKGSLIHDHAQGILIVNNLYAHNQERSPLFKGGTQGWVINNLIYDPGPQAVHYNLIGAEWGDNPIERGEITLIGNVLRAGPSTPDDVALFTLGGSGPVDIYLRDNIAVDRLGDALPLTGRYTTAPVAIKELTREPKMPAHVTPRAATTVHDAVLKNAGARPWERDPIDARIIADTAEGRGEIIDSENEVGGYPPIVEATRRAFDPAQWDMATMEPRTP